MFHSYVTSYHHIHHLIGIDESSLLRPLQIVLIGQVDMEDRKRQEQRKELIAKAREDEHLSSTPREVEPIVPKGEVNVMWMMLMISCIS